MKKILLAVAGVVLFCSFAFGEWKHAGARKVEEPDGFRGIKWEQKFSTISDMEYARTDPSYGGIQKYIRKSDEMKIGGAQVSTIEYGFWQDKFSDVLVKTSGFSNWAALKKAVIEKFGRGWQPNMYIERQWWKGKKVVMGLTYNNITEEGVFWMHSQEISEQQEKHEKTKAKEGAETGF